MPNVGLRPNLGGLQIKFLLDLHIHFLTAIALNNPDLCALLYPLHHHTTTITLIQLHSPPTLLPPVSVSSLVV